MFAAVIAAIVGLVCALGGIQDTHPARQNPRTGYVGVYNNTMRAHDSMTVPYGDKESK